MIIYMLAAAAGLSALFAAVPVAYDIVRLAGAAYLLWLAFKAFTGESSSVGASSLALEAGAELFRRGLLTCLLNPKIVITYGTLLPQFVEPSSGSVLTQIMILGLVQIVAAASVHSLVIFGASSVSSFLGRNLTFVKFQRYLLGTVLAALAVRLVVERPNAV